MANEIREAQGELAGLIEKSHKKEINRIKKHNEKIQKEIEKGEFENLKNLEGKKLSFPSYEDTEKQELARLRNLFLSPAQNRQNIITHTSKIIHPDSNVSYNFLFSKNNLKIFDGYISSTSTNLPPYDYRGAARYATLSSILYWSLENKYLQDLLDNEDDKLKNLFGFSDKEWEEVLKTNNESHKYFTNVKIDSLAKQIAWPVKKENGDTDYVNMIITPSPLLMLEIKDRIKNRGEYKDFIKEEHSHHFDEENLQKLQNIPIEKYREQFFYIKKTAGGSQPNNISYMNSKASPYFVLSGEPFVLSKEDDSLKYYVNKKSFFNNYYNKHNYYSGSFQSLVKLFKARETYLENKDIKSGIENLFTYLIEQLIIYPASKIQDWEPGWSADIGKNLPNQEKQWLDPHFEENQELYSGAEIENYICKNAVKYLNTIFKNYNKFTKISTNEKLIWVQNADMIKKIIRRYN